MARHIDVGRSDVVKSAIPALADLAMHIGDPAVRNRGTIGGSIARAASASDLPAVLLACDGSVVARGPNGERELPFAEFPVAYMTPSIDLNELVVGARFPQWAANHGYAFVEFARRHGDFAITSAAVIDEASEQPARLSGISTVFFGLSSLAVSAMKCTPHCTITEALTLVASTASCRLSPTISATP